MKRLLMLAILLLALFSATVSFAQVNLTADGGTLTGSYTTLKTAFDAINAGTHTGAITLIISGTTTETASAVLNASGSGSASYSSLSIQPLGSAVISGAMFGHLIDLNGADNVIIDGLNTAGNSLTISNTGTASASTIRFYGDATNNTVTNCSLQGATTSFGVVNFSSGAITGNDNNTISNCNIGPAGANNPLNGIYSMGTSAAIDNSGNIISNNNIFDYYNTSSATNGMNINTGNSAWTITNNKLYQTSNRVYTSASTHNGIFITSGAGYTITDNTIGFANSGGTGTTNMIGLTSGSLGGIFPSAYTVGGAANATKYAAINCAFTAGGTVSSIQNNTISGFALYTASSTSGTFGVFCGIAVTTGNVNIGTITGNSIGTPTSSIYTATTISAGAIAGIYVTSSNTVNIQNNILQNLDAMGTSATTAGSINGINTEGAGGTFVVSGNTIGNTTTPNLRTGNLTSGTNLSNIGTTFSTASGTSLFQGIRNAQAGTVTIGAPGAPNIIRNANINSTGSLALFRGIYSAGGTTSVSYNTISNLTSASTGTSYSSGGLAGIGILMAACINPVISNNTISGLSLTNTGTGGYTLAGIVYNTPNTSITVSKNKIYGLSNASTSISATAPGTATGIFIRDGAGANTSIDNNMISLGSGETSNIAFIGIWPQYSTATATTLKIYYNSINIEGNLTVGTQPSMCIQRGDFSATAGTVYTIDAKNNIFNNTRSGGTGKHYALANNFGAVTSSAAGWGANASNYNLLNANPATVGYWSGDQTFALWQTASASDNNSVTGDPKFVSSTDLHIQTTVISPVSDAGTSLASINFDFDGDSRSGTPDIGADEYTSTVYAVTFRVDMSTAAGFVPGTDVVYLTGSLTGWAAPGAPGSITMTQVGTSLMYTTSLPLNADTYYYKYFKNAGWGGGEWNGDPNRSVTIAGSTTVNNIWGGDAINWANLQSPVSGIINLTGTLDVYANVYIANGITAAAGATYGLQAWIGYSTGNTDPSTWTNWIAAPFNSQQGSNDEFKAAIGAGLSYGTYYYASRFQWGTGPYVYGGYNSGFWNGTTNVSGVLLVSADLGVNTSLVTGITTTTAISGGDVTSDGGSSVTARGVCWGLAADPVLGLGNFTTDGTGTGVFISQLIGLNEGTTYHVRAYATNSTGTVYGSDMQFTTLSTVTFNVDMSTAPGFIAGTDAVYLVGAFPGANWIEPGQPGSQVMTQVGTTDIYTITLPLPTATNEYKYFRSPGGWGSGEYAGGSNRSVTVTGPAVVNNIWGGDAIQWANVQWPGTGDISLGGSFDVYAQAYINGGVTGLASGALGLQAWVGYSTGNTDPSTWTNWVVAPFSSAAGSNDEFKANLGASIATGGTYYYASRFQLKSGAYVYGGFNGGFWNGTTNVSGVLTVTEINKTLNISSVFLEGLYDPTTGTMNQAKGAGGVPQYGAGIADQITIELHSSITPASIGFTVSNVNLSTSGVATITSVDLSPLSGSYYITIKHRNSVETTSIPVSFATSPINVAFTPANVYFSYLKNVTGSFPQYCIYAGDVDQDRAVGVLDMTSVDNKSKIFATGYIVEDVDGDGSTGVLDMTLIDNNSKLFVSAKLPY